MYLHHPDWTPGTFHFRPSIERGQGLMRELRGRLPGAAIPHYVLEIPQGQGKASLLDASARKIDELKTGSIQGAVYELAAPWTRTGRGTPLYLDLFGSS
jgi:L-lysine 2,3-aminomutase